MEGDLAAVPRFELDLEARGSLKPGQPVQIAVNVRSDLPTQEAEIALILPEVAAAHEAEQHRGNRDIIELPINVLLPAEFSERASLEQGQTWSKQVSVRIEEPGYYMVVATAHAPSEESLTEEGQWIDNFESKEIWLWIDENGGA